LRYSIGIDLGTTNSALAEIDLAVEPAGPGEPLPGPIPVEVPQLVAQGETAPREVLPSFIYLPPPHEALGDFVVGSYARDRGAQAGLARLTLLEEPQATLYAWVESAGDDWRKQVQKGDVILVVDVGGGTSDFSLISVGEDEGRLALTRVAVGDHILLGGDNVDLALAHVVQQKLSVKLDPWQFNALTHACRRAKETGETALAIPGR